MMRYFHQKQNLPKLIWVISLSVFLRSFIAPGFMLGATDDGGFGIIFCNGPAGIYAQDDTHTAHHHDPAGDDSRHQGHVSPTCTHWSTSSLCAVNAQVEPASIILAGAESPIHYQPLLLPQFFETSRTTRGPPALS